jgi:hypothetical protein
MLDDIVGAFGSAGYREADRTGPLEARVERADRPALVLRFVERGRVFGGQIGLEVATVDPVLPPTPGGLVARPRGAVRLRGFSFRARDRDPAGEAVAQRLAADRRLAAALGRVHFERVRVDPDGRPVIRQVGGSVVWMLFPPLVRPVPLVPEQAKATAEALDAFAAAGEG